eukprot:CAMPEP_0119121678 /NCGR_PEP_ID=MMETSP1310-20130426/2190_1 /TAXON_ID=464262 /ORGANISM="Genus nov. species nov., Strain RCC2339" /LENGTH=288 /DNA_ID=CAMNT_0007111253 /DNA_START=831 /DNA_END=1697 /DNA_ORIENTATION=+
MTVKHAVQAVPLPMVKYVAVRICLFHIVNEDMGILHFPSPPLNPIMRRKQSQGLCHLASTLVCLFSPFSHRSSHNSQTAAFVNQRDTMVKLIKTSEVVEVLPDVTVAVKNRNVRVKGPRGQLTKNFKHFNCDLRMIANGKKVLVELWFGTSKQKSCVQTVCSLITNMMVGVTQGYRYKMRFAYAHFPIKVAFPTQDPKTGKKIKEGSLIEVRNFLGEFFVRRIYMRPGCKVFRSEDVKDEIVLEGNDLAFLSQSAAEIQQSVLVKNKDIRKFLDGIYVSESGPIEAEY